jgi:hypothetical protein
MKLSLNQLNQIILKELGIRPGRVLLEASLKDRIKSFQKIIGMSDDKATGDWIKDKTDDSWVAFLKKYTSSIKKVLPNVDIEAIGKNWATGKRAHYSNNLGGITEFAQDVKETAAGDEAAKQKMAEKLEQKQKKAEYNKVAEWGAAARKKHGSVSGGMTGFDSRNFRYSIVKKIPVTIQGQSYNLGLKVKITNLLADGDRTYVTLTVVPTNVHRFTDPNFTGDPDFNVTVYRGDHSSDLEINSYLKNTRKVSELKKQGSLITRNNRSINGKGLAGLAARGLSIFSNRLDYKKLADDAKGNKSSSESPNT